MDELKKYIDQNRAAFDDEVPSAGVWEKIAERSAAPPPAKRWTIGRNFIQYAAAAVILLTLGGMMGYLWRGGNVAEHEVASIQEEIPGAKEFAEAEQFYDRKISLCKAQLETRPEGKSVLLDLAKMEHDYQLLEKELSRTKNPEKVLHAMIENSRKRLALLELVLGKLQEHEGKPKPQYNM